MATFNEKVREVLDGLLDGLEDEEDFIQAVRDEINFAEVVGEAMQDDDVKRAVKKAVVEALKSLIEDGDNQSLNDAVSEQVNFDELVKEALGDEETRKLLREAVASELKRVIGDYQLDSEEISQSVDFVAETKALVEAKDPKILKAIRNLIIADAENWGELIDDERENVREALGISTLLDQLLADSKFKSQLDQRLRELIDGEMENLGQRQSNEIAKAILDSPTFKAAIERVVSDIDTEEFAKGIVERAMRESHQFQTMVLEQVQRAVIAKLAEGLVKTALGSGK